MELGLSLGDAPKLLEIKIQKQQKSGMKNMGPNFCMDLSLNSCAVENQGREKTQKSQENDDDDDDDDDDDEISSEDNLAETPLQLNLLPLAPLPHRISNSNRPCFSHNGSRENGWLEVNRRQGAAEEAAASSANSDTSTGKREFGGSDDDENAPHNPKKLRLSKQQSEFLEQSFKEHNTLNPKQKLALANHLNLRPRQVEIWFQNRRARTKLKQTEVDCEYLKRCCETLSEENRRLHKELQELRALKTWNPLCMQMPATTLTMCPSCAAVLSTNQDSTR